MSPESPKSFYGHKKEIKDPNQTELDFSDLEDVKIRQDREQENISLSTEKRFKNLIENIENWKKEKITEEEPKKEENKKEEKRKTNLYGHWD